MRKGKKKLIILIVILTLIILAIGIFLFLYVKTDLFSSPQEIVQKSISQSVQNLASMSNGASVKTVEDTIKQMEESKFTFNGKVDLNVSDDVLSGLGFFLDTNELNAIKQNLEIKNDMMNVNLKVNADIDKTNKYTSFDVSANSGNTEMTGLQYLKDKDTYAAKLHGIKQFVSSNDKDKMNAVGFNFVEYLDKLSDYNIDFDDKQYLLTDDEKKQLSDKFLSIINYNIPSNKYKKVGKIKVKRKDQYVDSKQYDLDLTGKDLANLAISLLQEAKENQIILDKIDQIEEEAKKENPDIDKDFKDDYTDYIDEIIDDCKDYIDDNNNDNSDNDDFNIKLSFFVSQNSVIRVVADYKYSSDTQNDTSSTNDASNDSSDLSNDVLNDSSDLSNDSNDSSNDSNDSSNDVSNVSNDLSNSSSNVSNDTESSSTSSSSSESNKIQIDFYNSSIEYASTIDDTQTIVDVTKNNNSSYKIEFSNVVNGNKDGSYKFTADIKFDDETKLINNIILDVLDGNNKTYLELTFSGNLKFVDDFDDKISLDEDCINLDELNDEQIESIKTKLEGKLDEQLGFDGILDSEGLEGSSSDNSENSDETEENSDTSNSSSTQSNENSNDMDEASKNTFNMQFLAYEGDINGSQVKSLINAIISSNSDSNSLYKNRKVSAEYKGIAYSSSNVASISGLIDTADSYNVSFKYGSDGYVEAVVIE